LELTIPESVETAHTLNCLKNRFDKYCIALKFSSALRTSMKIRQEAYGLYTTEQEDDDDDDE